LVVIASLLIANRGEIACRIIRTARRQEVLADLTPALTIIIASRS